MYYTIYKITNLINNKIYIGQHITQNLNDGYFGSGIKIRQALIKYGKSNFKKDIMYVYDNFDDMNAKEIELVNTEFILREDTYNISSGGTKWNTKDTLVVRNKLTNEISRIHKLEYSNNLDTYEAESKGKMIVFSFAENKNIRIRVTDFDPIKHKHMTSGKISVFDGLTNSTKSIDKHDYDPTIHKSVFGGIVVNKDGRNQYISKEEYYNSALKVKTSGHVTVYDKVTNNTHYVPKDEYDNNKERYRHISEGMVTGTHKITGIKKRFLCVDITKEIRDQYYFSTTNKITVKLKLTGECINISCEEYANNKKLYDTATTGKVVVYDITTNAKRFKAIFKSELDKSKHKLAKDKKFKIFDGVGNVIFEFWGSKIDIKASLLTSGIKLTKYELTKMWNGNLMDIPSLNNCEIIFYDWKNENGLTRKA